MKEILFSCSFQCLQCDFVELNIKYASVIFLPAVLKTHLVHLRVCGLLFCVICFYLHFTPI